MLSSLGIAADLQGQVLGEYTYDSQKDHYVQSTSNDVSDTEPKYLYQHPDYNDEWQARSCKRSRTLYKSLHFWLAGEFSWLAIEVLTPCQK